VDLIVDEPPGGAHQDHDVAARHLDRALFKQLTALSSLDPDQLRDDRYERFRRLGAFVA
jgi:acetyl-CoA carboxylase carboxyl transferase subunit alpha